MGRSTLPRGVSRRKKKKVKDTSQQKAAGRKGGLARSAAKTAAVRENAKLGGQPSLYEKRYCGEIVEFFNQPSTRSIEVARYKDDNGNEVVKTREVGVLLPTLDEFSCRLGVAPSTIKAWRKAHPAFEEAAQIALAHQRRMVVQNGMAGHYMQPMAVKYMTTNAGWVDRVAVQGGGEDAPPVTVLLKNERDKRRNAMLKRLEQIIAGAVGRVAQEAAV